MYTVAIELASLVFVGAFLYLIVRVMELKKKRAEKDD